MLKFDVRSSRVKGLSFHPQRSWILCGLHNGSIQIWDYDRNTSVDTFAGHEGSVRCVDFHSVQPLFVSGGDDFMVKVWNYKLRRCLYTLSGHTDYVRTTFFHLTKPWIVSASDDYTIRVWNWQSRCSIATLPGHNHYVMCAQFHQKLDLLVSASLDSTVRVWDLSNLGMASQESDLAQDLLGSSDVTVKYQLERHSRGVNWAEFHPTEPIVFSCADDCTVRQWYLNDCSNPRTFYCHKKNVSCVKFFGDRFIISNGEDNTIMVSTVNASGSTRSTPLFERDYDRYWTLAIHPSRHLIAAGHDSGLIVFKLFRERQPFTFRDDKTIFYVEKGIIVEADLETLKVVERNLELDSQQVTPDAISYDPGTSQVAIAFHKDERVRIVNPFGRSQGYSSPVSPTQAQRFFFIGPHKAAMLVGGKLKIKTFHPKETIQEVDIECTSLHPGPPGCVVCQRGDTALLYHIAQRGTLAEAVIPGLKYVYWDRHGSKVAFVSKNSITIMTKSFKHIATVAESSWRVKSVVFDEQRDILYFTTSNHLSYCNLRTGEYSTISSLRNVVYLVKAVGDRIWALHREGGLSSSTLDNFELNLKLKLHQNAYREVIQIIQRNDLKGQALVGYLRKHGHAEIALHFVSDPLTRFNLALECGSIEIAKASAQTLNKASIWRRLAEVAIQYGDIQLSQFASNNAGNYHYSGFLCALTENTATLGHLIDATDDESFKVQHGLLLGDVQQRVQILARAGQLPLAYLTAASNGLDDLAEELLAHMEPEVAENVRQMKYAPASPLIVGTPCTDNWPLLKTEDTFFARLLKEPGTLDAIVEPALEDDHVGAGWNDDEDDADGMLPADEDDLQDEDGEEAGGWDEDDLDLDVNAAVEAVESAEAGAEFVIPRTNAPISQQWTAVSSSPAVHVAAGSFATALNLLRRQIALADPLPLKPYMIALWASVNASRPGMYAPSSTCFVTRQDVDGRGSPRTMPMLPNYVPTLTDVLRTAFQLFVEGRFADALKSFEDILLKAVLTSVQSDEDKRTLRELISTAQEYARALSVQLALRNEEPSSNRALELSLYFTHFKLHRTHLTLALSQAMTKAYKKKNFKMAAGVARRLLEQEPAPTKAKQATAIIAEADKNPTDDSPLDFDERNPFTICSVSHTIMYRGNVESIFCSYCRAPAHPSHKGAVCPVCHIATLGAEYSGLVNEA